MDLGLSDKKALVCAASKGLGKAIAMDLAGEGAQLFICAREASELAKTARELEKLSKHKVHYFSADLSNAKDREALIANINTNFGTPDIIIHNVGGPKTSAAKDTHLADWQEGFDKLFQSVIALNQAFLPSLIKNNWGRIIIVTSLSVIEPIAGLSISNALRSAVTAMSKTLADEVAPFNITVNCLAPGMIHTDRTEELLNSRIKTSNLSKDEFMQDYLKSIPMKRLGEPKEFAAAACFLASTRASYITGSTICIDGGKRRSTY